MPMAEPEASSSAAQPGDASQSVAAGDAPRGRSPSTNEDESAERHAGTKRKHSDEAEIQLALTDMSGHEEHVQNCPLEGAFACRHVP